jgi:hypothetical protein
MFTIISFTMLYSYDSDRNFAPACLQGHKAHWAVITGVLVPNDQMISESSETPVVNLLPSQSSASLLQSLVHPDTHLHVIALQGKSRHLCAWPLHDLVVSNKNLIEVDPSRESGDIKYIIPSKGISKSLSGQSILLQSMAK